MKKNTKKLMITTLSATLALTLGAFVANVTPTETAKADTTDKYFEMSYGAQVSLSKKYSGIRFTAVVSDSWYAEQTQNGATVEFGMLIAPYTGAELVYENAEALGASVIVNQTEVVFDENGEYTYTGAIRYDDILADYREAYPTSTATDEQILASAYKMELSARAYAIVTAEDGTKGEPVYATSNNNVRSARQVANSALLKGDIQKNLSSGLYTEDDIPMLEARLNGYIVGAKERSNVSVDYDLSVSEAQTVDFAGLKGEIEEVLIDGQKVDATVNGTKVTLNAISGFSAGEHYLSAFDKDGNVYSQKIILATKIITKYEELTKLQEYTGVTAVNTGNVTYYNYEGYFILGRDIIAPENATVINTKSLGQLGSANYIVRENGFRGTFDGRNHSIVNAKFGAGGLLGDVSKYGVVKNLAVVNATVAEEDVANAGAGVLSFSFMGEADNVFVSYTTLKARNGVFGRAMSGATLNDMVVYYKYQAGYSGGALTSWVPSGSAVSVEDLYVVYADGMADDKCVTGTITEGAEMMIGHPVVIKEAELSTTTFTGLDKNVWNVATGALPIFKSALGEFEISSSEVTVELGKEITLTAGLKDIAGNVLPYYPVTWTSSNQDVATVENGVLTLLSQGETTIMASCGEYSATCAVTVEKAAIVPQDKTAVTLYLDANNTASLTEQLFAQAGKENLFETFTVTKVVDFADALSTDLTADANYLKTVDANGTARDKTLVIYGEEIAYKVSVKVVTKVITTASELANLIDYGTNKTKISTTYSNVTRETWSYNGYFVLGNNLTQDSTNPITFTGPSLGTANDLKVLNINSGWLLKKDGTEGFHGTFDGLGYKVDGFSYGVGGVFGFIGSNAVIKNVAFTNCVVGDKEYSVTRNESVLAQGAYGASGNNWTLDNVYVQGTMNGVNSGMLFGYWSYYGTISNTITQTQSNYTSDALGAVSRDTNHLTMNNFVCIYVYGDAGRNYKEYKPFGSAWNAVPETCTGALVEYELQSDGTIKKITSKTGSNKDVTEITLSDTVATAEEFEGFSSTYWTVTAGYAPVFKAKN